MKVSLEQFIIGQSLSIPRTLIRGVAVKMKFECRSTGTQFIIGPTSQLQRLTWQWFQKLDGGNRVGETFGRLIL